MRNILTALSVILLAGCAMAQNTSPPPMINPTGSGDIAQTDLSGGASVDQILDALDARGKGLQSFTADVSLTQSDTAVGDPSTRTGKGIYQLKGGGDGRIAVFFDTLAQGGKTVREKLIYMLDNGDLIDRNYRTKNQVTRQV